MAGKPRDRDTERDRRIELRSAVLHYGGLLGWPTSQVITFTETLTNCTWRQCGSIEFLAVLEEYLSIFEIIQSKMRRRVLQEEQHAVST